MPLLHRYWFSFERIDRMTPLNLGCGVTGFDLNDALAMLKTEIFGGGEIPPIKEFVEDVDVSTLDEKHVLSNIGLVTSRGIWFPKK